MKTQDEVCELAITNDATAIVAGDAAGHLATYHLATGELAKQMELPSAPVNSPHRTSVVQARRPAVIKDSSISTSTPGSLPRPESAAVVSAAKRATPDLVTAREAAAAAEEAVKLAEQSLAKLHVTAAKLRQPASPRTNRS